MAVTFKTTAPVQPDPTPKVKSKKKHVSKKNSVTPPPPPPVTKGAMTRLEAARKARESKKAFKKIYELEDEHRESINAMIADGRPISEVMAVLRDLGLFSDVKDQTLSQYLYRYKWKGIDKEIVLRADVIKPSLRAKLASEAKIDFDVVQEVSELIMAQKERVAKLSKREALIQGLYGNLGGEMKTLAGFIQQYAELSFDLGLLKKAPQVTKITKEGGTTFVESAGKDHVAMNMENAEVVERAANAFFAALEEEEDHAPEVQSL